jgi:hypothetical protein
LFFFCGFNKYNNKSILEQFKIISWLKQYQLTGNGGVEVKVHLMWSMEN